MYLSCFVPELGRCGFAGVSSCIWWVLLIPVWDWGHFVSGFSGIRLVPFWIVKLMYTSSHAWRSNLTLSASPLQLTLLALVFTPLEWNVVLSSCVLPYMLILACGGLSDKRVVSFGNKNPDWGSICHKTAEPKCREPSVNTLLHLSQHLKEIHMEHHFLLQGCR